MNLQKIAENAREYCENEQSREFNLDGACHENVIGAADYVRLNTSYDPIIVWGVVTHSPPEDTADSISNVSESETHFWLELEGETGIIDVYTIGDISEYIESGIAHGGTKPECYNTVEKMKYYGKLSPYDLSHKDKFAMVRPTTEML